MKFECGGFFLSLSLKHKSLKGILTRYVEISAGLYVPVAAAVKATVSQLGVFDGQFHDTTPTLDLILKVVLQNLLSSSPLHFLSRLGQLTTQRHTAFFFHLQVPQLCLERDKRSCVDNGWSLVIVKKGFCGFCVSVGSFSHL